MGLAQTSLVNGNGTIRDNLHDAAEIVPLQGNGYFAQGFIKNVRIFKSVTPLEDAFRFFTRLSFGHIANKTLSNKYSVAYMNDGAVISLRIYSVNNNQIVIEITIRGFYGIEDQKIYFISVRIGDERQQQILENICNAFPDINFIDDTSSANATIAD